MCPGLSRSTLLSAITTGLLEAEDAPRDEAVAGADACARIDDEEHDVDVVEGRVDGLLHALGERVDRALEARAGRRARAGSQARARRRRCGGASCWGRVEMIATFAPQSALTSVDLPTFGRPATATKPLFTGAFLWGTPAHHPLRA